MAADSSQKNPLEKLNALLQSSFEERASFFAKLGIRVFTVKPGTKAANGDATKYATTDLMQIKKWNRVNPQFNTALLATNETVCELDQDVEDLLAEYLGLMPRTLITQSSPGKRHLIFAQTERSRTLGNVAQNKTDGRFSFRCHNEYVVGAGSIHPKTLKPYLLLEVPEGRIPPIPDALVDYLELLIAASAQKPAKSKEPILAARQGKVPIGQRHDYLKTKAAAWRNAKPPMTMPVLEAALLREYEENCEHSPGDDLKDPKHLLDVHNIAEWAMSQEGSTAPFEVKILATKYSEITSAAQEWLLKGYLPKNAEVFMFGKKGIGKTKICDWLNAQINAIGKRVIRFNLEDPDAETLKPALYAAGGNLELTQLVDRKAVASKDGKTYPTAIDFSNPAHIAALKTLIREFEAAAVMIEPINNYKGKAKAISEDDMRPIHMALSEVAEELDICILVVSHENRKKDVDVQEKAHGAGSGIHVARVNLYLSKNPNNTEEVILSDAGSNLKVGKSLVFKMTEKPAFNLDGVEHKEIAIAELLRESDITATELLEESESTKQTQSKDIADFLRENIGSGEVLKTAVVAAARKHDPAWTEANIVKVFTRKLNGNSRSEGGGKAKKAFWSLAPQQAKLLEEGSGF
jgi:hypothetical protein